jgi:hypothetical protein
LENLGYGRLLLPHFLARNFGIAPDLKHGVWVESNSLVESRSAALTSEVPLTSLHALRGGIVDSELSSPDSSIRFARSAIREVWTPDPGKDDNRFIRQIVRERVTTLPSRLILVVDTSRKMRESVPEITAALRELPSDLDLRMIFANDTGAFDERCSLAPNNIEQLVRWVGTRKFEGGADNVPALSRALDIAEDNSQETAIVWIHNPQPVQLTDTKMLAQRLRQPNGPRLYSIQTRLGADRVEDGLDGASSFSTVTRLGSLEFDLRKLFDELTGREPTFEYVRSNESGKEMPFGVDIKQTSAHLARLWANDQIKTFLNSPYKEWIDGADIKQNAYETELAVQYELVTPLTSAVVMEINRPQMDSIGPMPPDMAGFFPESQIEGRLLLAILAVLLVAFVSRCVRSKTPSCRY